MMKSLDRKYLQDNLTADELLAYRKRLEEEPLAETESRIAEAWAEEQIPDSEFECTGHDLRRMKKKIDASIRKKPAFLGAPWILSYAAAILIIFFFSTTVSLYKDKKKIETNEVCLSTASGEKSHVRLPDGTMVNLNEESSITYQFAAFNRKERAISFSGEGYFDVARDEEMPFVINTGKMQVEVLGTKFLLVGRDALHQAEIILDEGSVRLQSKIADCTVALSKGQKAILDFSSGMISVSMSDKQGKATFNRTRIEFVDTPFEDIVKALSESYRVNIQVKGMAPAAHFTGYLPLTNLSEALEILSKVYGMDVSLTSGTFMMSSK